jgi:hypothetical protein
MLFYSGKRFLRLPSGLWQPRQACSQHIPIQKQTLSPSSLGTNFGVNYLNDNQMQCETNQNNTCDDLTLTGFINLNTNINFPGTYSVPASFDGAAFQGASAFQPTSPKAFWEGKSGTQVPNRFTFSENTCNGCHGAEMQTLFQQVVNRQPAPLNGGNPQPSNLAAFLVGCSNTQQEPLTQPCPSNSCTLQTVIQNGNINPACQNEVVQDRPWGWATVTRFRVILIRRNLFVGITERTMSN